VFKAGGYAKPKKREIPARIGVLAAYLRARREKPAKPTLDSLR